MGFSDTLKELLDQGLQVSREIAAKAGEKAQDWGSRGLEATKDFAVKAGAKVQELGEKGVLMLEIKQLEGQTKKLLGRFGAELYKAFEAGALTISVDDPEINAMVKEIRLIKDALEKREQELAAKNP
ncbi:MAG: hypothetical protein LBO65_10730 [Spirochaetaceae bacterium]|jgi:hypothetical protein|nr:hypothetical protein [Spirochaetaceae bacterium]